MPRLFEHQASNNSFDDLRLPVEFRKNLLSFKDRRDVLRIMRQGRLSTVCEEAKCPNIGECFSNKTATFMIMGDRCTRRCHFCSVTTKKPGPLEIHEPINVSEAVKKLNLEYVVITSVDRDDLKDRGADHFVKVVHAIKTLNPDVKIELLVPDFAGQEDLIDKILASPIDVFGHNIESVERLYKSLRPQSHFETSKRVLRQASSYKKIVVKTGMMVGVGESDQEVFQTLDTLRDLEIDIVTIGQYLRPSRRHWPVDRYVTDEIYRAYVNHGEVIGIKHIFAGPFVRSSYRAKETHIKVFSN